MIDDKRVILVYEKKSTYTNVYVSDQFRTRIFMSRRVEGFPGLRS